MKCDLPEELCEDEGCDHYGIPHVCITRIATDQEQQDALDRAEKAYADPNHPERQCDRCGTLYRGPAVYCSLECALGDA